MQQPGVLDPGLSGFLSKVDSNYLSNSSKPKAYLNWILLDEQFHFVPGTGNMNSGFQQVGADTTFTTFTITGQVLSKSGYLFVFVSNQTPNINVYFDNLQLTHMRGRILEETHYYPFGLAMAGISSQQAGALENKFKFSSKEIQHKEFSNGSGLEWYDMNFRMHDPQLGRFLQIDPLASKYSQNSPYAYAENKVTLGIDLEGLELLPFNSAWFRAISDYKTYQQYGDTKFWKQRVDIVAKNVPTVFKDASGTPLFSAASVNVGPKGKIWSGNESGPRLKPGNNLPPNPSWAWTEGDPDATASTGGWFLGKDLESNKTFADKAGAIANLGQEAYNWYDTYANRRPIWNAYNELTVNQNSFYTAESIVGPFPMGMVTTPAQRDDVVNFVNDGTLPNLDFTNLESSITNTIGVMQAGIDIMKSQNIQVGSETQFIYDLYHNLLKGIKELKKKSKNP